MTRMTAALFAALVLFAIPLVHADDALKAVLDAQPADVQARYGARHPAETLDFFGIKPGMTVIEAFPGGGWYTKLIAPWLGKTGRLIGADYALEMYPKFNFYDDAFLEKKKTWVHDWQREATGWSGTDGAAIGAFAFGSMPTGMEGTADAVLLIRALHNLARFENDGGYLSTALGEIMRALKPGGVVGIVQHMAPVGNSDAWADGSNGYLKKSFVIKTMTDAGFVLVGESAVNENPADQPGEKDYVWRLPPAFYGVEDEAARKKYAAIGESNRMTLLFRKPE